jgi:hypothetical protein
MILLSYQSSVDISIGSARFPRQSTLPPVQYWHWWGQRRMDLICARSVFHYAMFSVVSSCFWQTDHCYWTPHCHTQKRGSLSSIIHSDVWVQLKNNVVRFMFFLHKSKGKVRPRTGHQGAKEEQRYSSILSSSSAVNVTSQPLYPWERDPVPIV